MDVQARIVKLQNAISYAVKAIEEAQDWITTAEDMLPDIVSEVDDLVANESEPTP